MPRPTNRERRRANKAQDDDDDDDALLARAAAAQPAAAQDDDDGADAAAPADPWALSAEQAEIARRVCHDDAPVCIRCPVKDMCEFHAAMENERHKSRNPIRRLWRR